MAWLDESGLTHFWGRIRERIPVKVSDLPNDAGYITSVVGEDGDYFAGLTARGVITQKVTNGKNLLPDMSGIDFSASGVSAYCDDDGSLVVAGKPSFGGFYLPVCGSASDLCPDDFGLAGENLALSCDATGTATGATLELIIVFNGSEYVVSVAVGTYSTFVMSPDSEIEGFWVRLRLDSTVTYDAKLRPQLERGSSATGFEAASGGVASPSPERPSAVLSSYAPRIMSNAGTSTLQGPLHAIPGIADTLEIDALGGVTVERHIAELNVPSWQKYDEGLFYFDATSDGWSFGGDTGPLAACTHFKYLSPRMDGQYGLWDSGAAAAALSDGEFTVVGGFVGLNVMVKTPMSYEDFIDFVETEEPRFYRGDLNVRQTSRYMLSPIPSGAIRTNGLKDVHVARWTDKELADAIAALAEISTNIHPATNVTNGLMSASDKVKLDGIDSGANAYSLPPATDSSLGGVIPDGTTITVDSDGTIHGASTYELPTMSATTKGGAILGRGLEVEDGVLSVSTEGDGAIRSVTAEGHAEQASTTGKNLAKPNLAGSRTSGGITLTMLDDGSCTLNGTSTTSSAIPSSTQYSLGVLAAGTYTITLAILSGTVSTGVRARLGKGSSSSFVNSTSYIASGSSTHTFTADGMSEYFVAAQVNDSGTVCSNLRCTVQAESGSTATEYEPYSGGAPSPSPNYAQEIKVARGRNLLTGFQPRTNNGVTFSVNADGSITANGTATADASCATNDFVLPAGTYTASFDKSIAMTLADAYLYSRTASATLARINNSALSPTFTIAEDNTCYLSIRVKNGQTVSNLTIHPQLELGTTPTPYVPYGHVGLEVQGKNLAANDLGTVTTNGITFAPQEDGGIKITGTASANAFYWMRNTSAGIPLDAGTYVASADIEGTSNIVAQVGYVMQSGGELTYLWSTAGSYTSFDIPSGAYGVGWRVYVKSGATANATVHLQIERGSTATEYEPYHGVTVPIPLPSKGFAASLPDGTHDTLTIDGAGHVEWELNDDEVVLDGDTNRVILNNTGSNENYFAHTRNNALSTSNDDTHVRVLCDRMIGTNGTNGGINKISLISNKRIWFGLSKSDYPDASAANTWLQSNPLTVLYPLASPTTEDCYVDLPITVEGDTVSIPELEDVAVVRWADTVATEVARQWYRRAQAVETRVAALEQAVAEIATS